MPDIKRACERCIAALRPSSILNSIRSSIRATEDYYTARDTADLERAELERIISRTRHMATKLTGMALLLCLIICLCLVRTCNASTQRTPHHFDWAALPACRQHGLNVSMSSANLSCLTDMLGEMDCFFLPWDMGPAWQVLGVAVSAGSAVAATHSCVANDGSGSAMAACVFAYQAMDSGLEAITLDTFTSRSEDDPELYQRHAVEAAVRTILRRSFGRAPAELPCHVNHTHRRDAEYLHPPVPSFRLSHPVLGPVDLATHEHATGARVTNLSYANRGLVRRRSSQHKRLADRLFDARAALADPVKPSFHTAAAAAVLDAVSCFAGGGEWPDDDVLSVQMYDTTHQATFGSASLGILENGDADA